jgi:hypothetical protein
MQVYLKVRNAVSADEMSKLKVGIDVDVSATWPNHMSPATVAIDMRPRGPRQALYRYQVDACDGEKIWATILN